MALQESKRYLEIAKKLISRYPDTYGHVDLSRTLFLEEDEKAPKQKYADCRVIKYPYDYFTDVKFIITVYANNVLSFTDAQFNLLVAHEMMHIDESFEKLRKHDVEDFLEIIAFAGNPAWPSDPRIPDILEDGPHTKAHVVTPVVEDEPIPVF